MAEIHDAMELLRIEVDRGKKTQDTKIERDGEEKGREADIRTERRRETTVQPRQPFRQPPRRPSK